MPFARCSIERAAAFPADYNPPVHWEQLYDMPNAWEDRPHRYTKAIVEKEAAKGTTTVARPFTLTRAGTPSSARSCGAKSGWDRAGVRGGDAVQVSG